VLRETLREILPPRASSLASSSMRRNLVGRQGTAADEHSWYPNPRENSHSRAGEAEARIGLSSMANLSRIRGGIETPAACRRRCDGPVPRLERARLPITGRSKALQPQKRSSSSTARGSKPLHHDEIGAKVDLPGGVWRMPHQFRLETLEGCDGTHPLFRSAGIRRSAPRFPQQHERLEAVDVEQVSSRKPRG